MEFAKLLEQHLQESASIIKRRTNMLGQHLSNIGFEDVEVTVHIETKVREPNGSGISIQKIEGVYKKYEQGFGPPAGKGNGSLEDIDGCIPLPDSFAPQSAPAAPPQQPSSALYGGATRSPISQRSGSQRPSAFSQGTN